MIHIELLPFTNKQTGTIKFTCDTGYMYMDLSSLVYFTLSNLIHLKLYLILVFVMWSAPRIATSGQVQHRKSAIHGHPVTLRMLKVKSDKSDWFWSQSIVFTKPFKTGMSLSWLARGRDSWC